jgi:tetratricopeptide (TPR) repeat protein
MIGLYQSIDVSQSVLDESLNLYRELGDQAGIALALTFKGMEYSGRARPNAVHLLNEALALWTAVDDAWGIGICEYGLAETRSDGDPEKARLLQHSVVLLGAVGDRWSLAFALNALGTLTWLEGDGARARALFEETLTALAEVRGAFGAYWALTQLFEILIAQGCFDEARETALAFSAFGSHPRLQAVSYIRLGQVDYMQGRLAEARARFEASLEIFRELKDPGGGMGWVPPWLGCVAYREGNLEQARAYIDAGLAIHDPDEYWVELAFALLARGDVARAQGELATAARLYVRSFKMIIDHGMRPSVAEYLEAFAKLALAGEAPGRAARLLGAAAALRDEIGTPVPPVEQADYDQALARAREQLGLAAFETAWDEGRLLDWKQAAAYALESQPV